MPLARALPLAVVVCMMAVSPVAPSRAQGGARVRVGVVVAQDSVTVGSDGPVDAVEVDTGRRDAIEGGRLLARPTSGGIEIAGQTFAGTLRLQPRSGWLHVNGRPYRGALELRRTPQGRVTAVNDVDLEEYLYGVVRSEMDPRWPAEALRAQAVAARSLALQSVGRFAAEGYDVRATTDSQVYGGVTAEDPRTTAAVDATRGLAILVDGRPAFAAFHADSGGATENSEFVWGSTAAHLRGVPDPYSRDAPNHRWAVRLGYAAIEAQVRRAGHSVAGLYRVEVTTTSPSGRAMQVRLHGTGGALDLRGLDFRAALGLSTIRSTLFTIRPAGPERVDVAGRGSGHGVGLSQWGARGQAMAGRDYLEILRHYYTGISVGSRP